MEPIIKTSCTSGVIGSPRWRFLCNARDTRGATRRKVIFLLFPLACRTRCAPKLELSHTVKGHRQGDLKIFGEICATSHLFIHKLVFEKVTVQIGKKKVAVCFYEVQGDHLKNVSLTFFKM